MSKMRLLFLTALACVLGFTDASAGQGGPDAYGYTWMDSDEPGGPSYSWVEIQGAPGAVRITGLADDNSVGPFNMGWSFHYYWTDANWFKFGSNGWVGFNNIGNMAHCFPVIPTAGGSGNNFIAPFMTDLNFASSYPSFPNIGEVWYWDNGNDTLIIEWVNVPWWKDDQNGAAPPDWAGSNTFQIILSGVDSSITYNYKDMDPANFNDVTTCNTDIQAGIENITGNVGLEVFSESVPSDSFTVKFYYPAVVTFQVPDATPDWNANSDNAGQFFLAGSTATPVDMVTNIKNVGNAPITNAININGQLLQGATQIWTSSASFTGLLAGEDSLVTFPLQVTFTNPGQYTYRVTTTNNQDINPSNNQNNVEISAVTCENDTMNLSYATGNIPDGAILWTGGQPDEGGGVYIEPPFYPVTVEAIDVFIPDIDQTPTVDGFAIVVYDDSGVPGTILDSVFVLSGDVVDNSWNRVELNNPATITSGGFYVGWFQGGANVALGTETASPISRRTYEILSGNWAPYRSGTAEDILINAHVSATCPAVGINNPNDLRLNLTVSPNPANGKTAVRYTLPATGDMALTMRNMYGQEVFRKAEVDARAGDYAYDLSTIEFPAGVYFVQVETAGGQMTTKLVIAH